ncbi:MAG: AAA family ATPase [Deltaproteobacteria bacterium]|nr:AAA family ATPase [Deltaproteobacteria bacterium]
MTPADAIARLRAALDAAIVGHDDAKTALVLARLARQHALLIGPSGCGKSALAEAWLGAAGGSAARIAFHRDTRAAALLGDVALVREPHARGERIALRTLPSALARAELWHLDDLERAPGEALAPLLRMLAEREGPHGALPLASAVATLLPRWQSRHADPPEPAQLDRFALQVRMHGLALASDPTQASALLARASELQADARGKDPDPTTWHFAIAASPAAAARVALPAAVLADWHALWRRIAQLCASAGAQLPSDRVVAAIGLAVLRAHALLHARSEAARADLRAARFMLAARVPESLLRAAEQLVERAAAGELAPPSTTPRAGRAVAGDAGGRARIPPTERREAERSALLSPLAPLRHRPEPADVSRLVRALAGRIDRAKAERAADPGGSPRRRAPLRRLDDALDADAAELLLWADGAWPSGPALLRRERRSEGGALALLRDISASMEGARTRLAADVIAGIVRAAGKRRMRIGYVEFHHDAEPLLVDGALFHRRTRALLERARLARAEGRTSYEAPLRVALAALRALGQRGGHIVLLTDGMPVVGDARVTRERALAQELGARIHTVFLGTEEMPALLPELAGETGGICFRAVRERSRVTLVPAQPPRAVAPLRAVR